MNRKQIYLFFNKNIPFIGAWMRRVKAGIWFNTVRRKVRGRGNIIRYSGAALQGVEFDIRGNDNCIEINPTAVLRNTRFFIRGDRHTILIRDECQFMRGGEIWFEDSDGRFEMGRHTWVMDAHFAVTEPGSKITIGEDCLFAFDIEVRTGDSHSILDSSTGCRINYAEDVTIGNHVWIAPHSVLLKGVSVADHSIVGVGAVVTKKFTEPGVLLGGNPAQVIKRGITWHLDRLPKPDLVSPEIQ